MSKVHATDSARWPEILDLAIDEKAVCPLCLEVGGHARTFEHATAVEMPRTMRRCRECGVVFSVLDGFGRPLTEDEARRVRRMLGEPERDPVQEKWL